MSSFPPPESVPPQPFAPPYPGAPGAPDPYSPFAAYAPAPPKPRTLGMVAMYVAIAVFVLSLIASIVVAVAVGAIATRTAGGFTFNTSELTAEQAARFGPTGLLMLAQMGLGSLFGGWALVQGIVAVATKRGRSFGIAAIALAGAAPIVSLVTYMVVAFAAAPPAG